jgi:hypothetical protein
VVRLEKLTDVADQFILVRLDKITGVDLRLFEFDYDLTWMGFFLNAEEKVYGRYGGRDAKSADGHLSLPGLRFALEAALAAHRKDSKVKPDALPGQSLLVEEYPAAKKRRDKGCIHCHQVTEFRRFDAREAGTFRREDLWVYPLPENVGLVLDNDQGNKVRSVAPGSAAARGGLRAGDLLQTLNGVAVASFADAQHGLNRAPGKGDIEVRWKRDGESLTAKIVLVEGWRKTNWTWRTSMLEILPSLSLFGDDLTREEKKALGLSEKRLAFRQDKTLGAQVKMAGVQAGDIIIGIDDLELEMTMLGFLAHVRQSYLVGDKITINVIRDGKRVNLPLRL